LGGGNEEGKNWRPLRFYPTQKGFGLRFFPPKGIGGLEVLFPFFLPRFGDSEGGYEEGGLTRTGELIRGYNKGPFLKERKLGASNLGNFLGGPLRVFLKTPFFPRHLILFFF